MPPRKPGWTDAGRPWLSVSVMEFAARPSGSWGGSVGRGSPLGSRCVVWVRCFGPEVGAVGRGFRAARGGGFLRGSGGRGMTKMRGCSGTSKATGRRSWPKWILWQRADVDKLALSASRTDLRRGVVVRHLCSGFEIRGWGGRGVSRFQGELSGSIEAQEKTGLSGLFAPGWVPEAEIADLVQAAGEDMLKEAAHELVAL